MKRDALLVGLLFLLFGSVPLVKAQETKLVDCFQYYNFGSVEMSLSPEKDVYSPGETVKFQGSLYNGNAYPLTNGAVYVKLFRRDAEEKDSDNQAENGDFEIGESWGAKEINLTPEERKEISFDYKLPAGLAKGEYLAQFFYTVADRYNLSGLSFHVAEPGGVAPVEVRTDRANAVYFDKDKAKVNGKAYQFRANNEPEKAGSDMVVTIPLANPTETEAEVTLKKELFYWDALDSKNLLAAAEEKFKIPAGQVRDVAYTIVKPDRSVYLLRLTATSAAGDSVINIRPAVENVFAPRIAFSGVTSYPLFKGKNSVVMTCFHNTSSAPADGKVIVTLKDGSGKTIAQGEYAGAVTSPLVGIAREFTAQEDAVKMQLTTEIYDKTGKLLDSTTLAYDNRQIYPADPDLENVPYIAAPAPEEIEGFEEVANVPIQFPGETQKLLRESDGKSNARNLGILAVVLLLVFLAGGLVLFKFKKSKTKNSP